MEKTAGGSYSMWNFVEGIRKFVGDQQKKPHSLGVPFLVFFGLGIGLGSVHTFMDSHLQ